MRQIPPWEQEINSSKGICSCSLRIDVPLNSLRRRRALDHEIAHVDLKHCVESFRYEIASQKLGLNGISLLGGIAYHLTRLGFSEQQELESDAWGAEGEFLISGGER